MKIAVSACLVGTPCKYNGKSNANDSLCRLLSTHEVIPLCPEVEGGLTTPRTPSERRGSAVINAEGEDVTGAFNQGAAKCADKASLCDLAVLQPRSPSCGVRCIYDGTFTGTLVEGQGVFAAELCKRGIPCFEPDDVELEKALKTNSAPA